tara:strand:- start:478 stop:732 length:255 start_codon:yes stop_codon:yes gene_type:complete
MNLDKYKPIILETPLGETHEVSHEKLRENNYPLVIAFLDDDDCLSMTITRQGAAFVPVTYRKQFVHNGFDSIVSLGASLAGGLG